MTAAATTQGRDPKRPSPIGRVPITHAERQVGAGPLAVLLAAATLVVMAGAVISPVVAVIRGEFGLGPSQAGLVITTHSLLIALSGPLVGSLIDRVGTRLVLLTGMIAYAALGAQGRWPQATHCCWPAGRPSACPPRPCSTLWWSACSTCGKAGPATP